MSDDVELFVNEVPPTQGNHIVARHGKIIDRTSRGLRLFRESLYWEAVRAHRPHVSGAVVVDLSFELPRPARTRYPIVPAGRPDIDKLSRSVLDALVIAEVIDDDARVVDLLARKRWAVNGAGVAIRVRPFVAEDAA